MRTPDPSLVEALSAELAAHHVGRENATTWADLLDYLNRYPYCLAVREPRRLQEAASTAPAVRAGEGA